MENQRPPAKRSREEAAAAGSVELEDRISQLPEPILDQIISLLSQKDAVQSSILSKSWRHVGPTRPKLEFRESDFRGSNEKFLSAVVNTIQRYADQNLSIKEFTLGVPPYNNESKNTISLLKECIPIVLSKMGLKTFRFSGEDFPLSPVFFQSEFLEELFLQGCKFNSTGEVQELNSSLRKLSLRSVYMYDQTFEKIMSSCPLIQHLVISSCRELIAIKVNKARNLKHLDCFITKRNGSIEIDDAPSLETIRIFCCETSYYPHLHYNTCFSTRLKSLYLRQVHLPTGLLNNLSSKNCPCLEKLELHYCFGLTEFKLSNRSIKCLIIKIYDCPIKAADIDVANILYFEFVSSYLPSIISFATTSREWKSRIHLSQLSYSNTDVLSTWSLIKLHEFLMALSQSQISLDISYFPLTDQVTFGEPVVVEHLCLKELYSFPALAVLLNCLFRICRPRYIGLSLYNFSQKIHERQLAESLWKTLVEKAETTQCYFWKQDLEESSIQVLEENAHEWRPVQVCALSNNQSIRFRLKWRDLI